MFDLQAPVTWNEIIITGVIICSIMGILYILIKRKH